MYLTQGLFKTQEYNIQELFCCVNNIVKYIENLPHFGQDQGLTEDEIIKLVEFALPW